MKKNLLFGIILVVVLGIVFFLTLYKKPQNDVLVFGSLLPLSGKVSAYGEMMEKGQLLALNEINQNNKDSVNIEFFNTEHKKDVALSRLMEAQNKGVKYFIEIFGSDQVEHCLNYAIEHNLFILSGVDTKPNLVQLGKGNFLRIMPSDAEATKEIFNWMEDLKVKKVAILYVNDDWGTGLLNSAIFNLNNSSLNLVGKFDINKGQQSFASTVIRLKETKPDAVCLFIYPDDGGRFMKEAYRQEFPVQFYATENFTGNDMIKTAQTAAEGVKLIVPSTPENNPVYNKMIQQYKEKYGEDPTIFAIKGYDAVHVMFDILQKTKSQNIDEVKKEVKANYTYQGASGKISFDKNGEFISSSYERLEYKTINDTLKLIPTDK
jgi:branched-chain amino acid transport system substrate-binding protein